MGEVGRWGTRRFVDYFFLLYVCIGSSLCPPMPYFPRLLILLSALPRSRSICLTKPAGS
ncbi:hypothetical protein NIES4101_33780 [Calothrix sp. NIES-4101]|nr:hypothetical protein NIES4101_33780 [Calothrix sp. NIES-4101]